MLPLAQPGLTVPAVAGRGLNEWLGRTAPRRSYSHLNQLEFAGCSALDGHGGFGAAEVACNERNEFFIRLAVYGWSLQLREPRTFRCLSELAGPGVGLHFDLKGDRCHEVPLNGGFGSAPRQRSRCPVCSFP